MNSRFGKQLYSPSLFYDNHTYLHSHFHLRTVSILIRTRLFLLATKHQPFDCMQFSVPDRTHSTMLQRKRYGKTTCLFKCLYLHNSYWNSRSGAEKQTLHKIYLIIVRYD